MELGNAVLSRDGKTFFVAYQDGADLRPTYFSFDLNTNTKTDTFEVPATEYPGFLTAEVFAC